MASTGLFGLGALTAGANRADNVLALVDVHDTTQAPQGSTKKVLMSQLFRQETTAVTVSTPLIDARQTWNAGGVTFRALTLNIVDTASAAASLLLDLQVGGVSQFKVSKAGIVTTTGALAITGALTGATTGAFSGAVTVGGALGVTGITTLQVLGANTGTFSGNVDVAGNIGLTSNAAVLTGKTAGAATVALLTLTSDAVNITRFLAGVDAGGFQWTNQTASVAWMTLAAAGLTLPIGSLTVSTGAVVTPFVSISSVIGQVAFSNDNHTKSWVLGASAASHSTDFIFYDGTAAVTRGSIDTLGAFLWIGAASFGAAVTVAAGGIAVTGNSSIIGTLTTTAALIVQSGGASVTGGFTADGGLIQLQHATATLVKLDTTNGAATDTTTLDFRRGGVSKWKIGNNIDGANTDTFTLRDVVAGTNVLVVDAAAITLSRGLIAGAITATSLGMGLVSINSSGLLTTRAASAAAAYLNLPQGSAPSAPNNGDVWMTSAGLFYRANGATVGPLT